MSDRTVPIGGFNFRVHVVEIGPRGGSRRTLELAIQQVVLPTFRGGPALADSEVEPVGGLGGDHLVLRRGHTGSPELYDWWDDEMNPKSPGRRVSVTLLDRELQPVTVWRFGGCHLVALRYSPLDALESTVLMETAEISFESIRQLAAER